MQRRPDKNNQGVVNSLNDLLACDKAVPATPVSWEMPEELADLFLVYLKSDQAPEKVARVQYLLNISDSTAESLQAMKYKGSSNGSAEQEDIEHEHPVKAFGLAATDSSGHLSPFKFSRNSPEGQLVMMMCGVEAVQRQLRSTTCPATSPSVMIAFASSPTAASILSGATPTLVVAMNSKANANKANISMQWRSSPTTYGKRHIASWNKLMAEQNKFMERIHGSFSLHRASMGCERGCGAGSVRSEYDDIGVMGGGDGEDDLNSLLQLLNSTAVVGRTQETRFGDLKMEMNSLRRPISDAHAIARLEGYNAPEQNEVKRLSQKADVYSFGVVVLEVLTGREGADLPRWVQSVVRDEWTAEVFDQELLRYKNIEEEMVSMLHVAMACVVELPEKRPTMAQVVKMIEDIRV
ncbi:hypothetical protein SASPL_120829 [Salvia splendens]|uniref:Serine-threonine/tyrosine-protein kinase catalytic domain-containing protein n=1 Tax=Salvia splendens TaxID=180675 RepID=A0A8X8XV02_SALSN|nr:hypothetical protein SASPL_120829 [Salvia splendens]